MHIALSLAYLDDADAEPDPVMLVPYDWDSVRTWAVERSKELLADVVQEPFPEKDNNGNRSL